MTNITSQIFNLQKPFSREFYLKNQWVAYPAMPPDQTEWGRICRLNTSGLYLEKISQFFLWPLKSKENEALLSALQVGDLISIKTSSQSKEKSETSDLSDSVKKIDEIHLLAPCLSSSVPQLSSSEDIQKKWQDFLFLVRNFFTSKNFVEISTPSLVVCPGTEATLDPFLSEFELGSFKKKLFLPTSPELHLKKALAAGYENIFEIRPCFRNGEISPHHEPEFFILEWYRGFSSLDKIKTDLCDLLNHLFDHLNEKIPLDHLFFPKNNLVNTTMKILFKEYLNFDLEPTTSLEELKTQAKREGFNTDSYSDWDDLFHLLFLEKIEKQLNPRTPLIIEMFPPSQAALARINDQGWADRFEFYWGGFEIANAFHELNDPNVQKLRFQNDIERKKTLKKAAVPLDDSFLAALNSGLPPSGGIALGLERLFMTFYKIDKIQDLKVFPYSKILDSFLV